MGAQPGTRVTAVAMAALMNIGSADAYSGLLKYLVRVTDIDERQQKGLRIGLAERGLTEEGAKVIREALEHESFTDSAVRDLLADALKTKKGL